MSFTGQIIAMPASLGVLAAIGVIAGIVVRLCESIVEAMPEDWQMGHIFKRKLSGNHDRRAGRPSKYRQEYCDIVEHLGRQGKSPAQMAAILNVDRASFYRWAAVHHSFAQSLVRARTFAQAWWEDLAQQNLESAQFQAEIWRASMAARFKDDYTVHAGRIGALAVRELVEETLDGRVGARTDGRAAALKLPTGSK